ncbi:MAG TPA: tetratricopeptide repeat protein [Candidatus Dormibacteraeota bacterium]|nr:tetratricopeptide repeat protein [Candidatus Dormibacteraeota bacterium]
MKRFLALCILMLLCAQRAALGDGTDDMYVRIYNLIQEADLLSGNNQANDALAKYLDAQTNLQRFQRLYPDWNVKVVSFRLSYIASRIAALSTVAAVPSVRPQTTEKPITAPVPPTVAPARTVPPDWEDRVSGLQNQVRQLQADKIVLEAKLKESLSVQPASLDPRELATAQEKMKHLQKENELLKVNLDQAKAARAVDPRVLQQNQQALAEANRKLTEQTEKSRALETEKVALQNKLNTLTPGAWNAANIEGTRKALEDANRQIAQQKEIATQLASEKETLQARLKAVAAETDSAAALRAENAILKKELADLRAAPPAGKASDSTRELAQAQAQIATLQSDRELLRLEKVALENRVKQLSAYAGSSHGSSPVVTSTVLPPPGRADDNSRIKDLEHQRDDLQKRLDTANKELYGRNGKGIANRVLDLESELAIVRARLQVFEARQVPYTAEELALFKAPENKLTAAADPRVGKKSVHELPPGAATMVADGQRYFAAHQLDKAEERYTQALHQDEKNVPILANLAAIQLAENHLPDAEKNVKAALAQAPDDAYSLGILGQIKLRQEKYEEALDILSRAAKLDPDNAQVQNLLGLALSEKGMRGPAETALRKAIQLEPGYGDAHANLAVVYITQHPPLVELARWHYQKALAAGTRPNPFLEKMLSAPKTADAR